jgi:hypothetical protein
MLKRINREILSIKKKLIDNNVNEDNDDDKINNLQYFFMLNNYDKGKFNMSLEPLNNTKLILSINYVSNQKLKIDYVKMLPKEINNLIAEYLLPSITLKFEVEYPQGYPFGGICWRLIYCDNEFSNLKNIYKYYAYIAEEHTNYNLTDSWSPAITVDKDILIFLTKIINFDELIYCL